MQTPECRIDGKNVLITRIIHVSGNEIISSIELVSKDEKDPQKLGAAITYMRRYSIISILGLEAEDDDGNEAAGKNPASDKQLDFIRRLAEQAKVSIIDIKKKYKLDTLPKMTSIQASDCIEALNKRIDDNKKAELSDDDIPG